MLVHCWAGVSRSMAAAYILLCDRFGPGHEEAIAQPSRLRAPHAYPNALLVQLADAALGREGRMIARRRRPSAADHRRRGRMRRTSAGRWRNYEPHRQMWCASA